MVPEEWPISLPEIEPADHAHVAGGDRLSAVMTDFFLDPAKRLSEQERALIGSLLDGLVGWIADQIRSALPAQGMPANDADGHALRQCLAKAGLLQRRDLMALLLRNADEDRIAVAVRSRFPGTPAVLQRLISSSSAEISAAAMEAILARGRRRDRFGQPRVDFDDLPERVAAGLAHGVAAALREMADALGSNQDGDRELSGAAAALLGRRNPDQAIDVLLRGLVHELAQPGLLDDAFLESVLKEGDIRIVVHGLAYRALIDDSAAWDLLASDDGAGAALLLRMAGVTRGFAAQFVAAIGDQIGIADPARGIQAFDGLDQSRIDAARAWMQLDPAYRSAAGGLGHHG
jgi:hypothetical protein